MSEFNPDVPEQNSSPADQPDVTQESSPASAPEPELSFEQQVEAAAKEMAKARVRELNQQKKQALEEAQAWKHSSFKTAQQMQDMLARQSQPPQAQPEGIKPENFPTYEAFLEAKNANVAAHTAAHIVQQTLAQRDQQEQVRQLQGQVHQVQAQALQNIASVQEKYPDFKEVMAENWESTPITEPMTVAISRMGQVGGDVAYYLIKNPGIAGQIAAQSPLDQAIAMGSLQAMISSTGKTVSSAPSPGKPGGGRAASSVGFRDNMSPQEYDTWREKTFGKDKR